MCSKFSIFRCQSVPLTRFLLIPLNSSAFVIHHPEVVLRDGVPLGGRQATVQSFHDTVDDAYAWLDAIAEKLPRDGAPSDYLELYVVDEQRQPVARPGAQ